ncbi:MAG: hypothetical protein ABEH86_02415 [Haloarcula sp.]
MVRSFQLSLFAVVVVVVLAGCGGPGSNPTPPAERSPTAEAPGPDTEDAVPAGTDTPGPAMNSVATALERHGDLFANQTGYVAEMTFAVETRNMSTEMRGTVREDLETGEQFTSFVQTYDNQSVTAKEYKPAESERGQKCVIFDEGCQRHETIRADEMRDANNPNPVTGVASISTLPRFTDEGVVESEFGPQHRYVADGVEALPKDSRSMGSRTVTDFHMELFFDEETGLLRKFVVERTFERDDGSMKTTRVEITYTEYGDVTIDQPDWYKDESDRSQSLQFRPEGIPSED